jgi:carbon monoxide dehydrogenase subunit G
MDIAGIYTFQVPQKMVWAALQDPIVLGAVVRTCWGVEKVAENQYVGTLQFKAGTIQGIFKGTIKLSNLRAPDSYEIEVNGKGIPGVVRVTGGMRLETNGNNTIMHYSGKSQFGGRMASVGQRVLELAVRAMIQESLQALDQYLLVELKHQQDNQPPD